MPVPELDPRTTALVLIDLQRGITAFPAEPHAAADVIATAARLAARFRAAAAPVVLVRVATSADGGDRLHAPVDEAQPARQLPADFSEIVPELGPEEGDVVVTKRQWGAFYGTDLDLQLRRRGDPACGDLGGLRPASHPQRPQARRRKRRGCGRCGAGCRSRR